MSMNGNKEYRLFKMQVRSVGSKPMTEGYAAVFNDETDLGYCREKIAPGAFARALRENQDVRCLYNHNPDHVLGRTKNGTLRLKEDTHGLHIENDMPDTQTGKDVHALVKRGDVDQMSFGFIVKGEDIAHGDDGTVTRTINDVDLFDVSIVTYPAYEATSVEARSLDELREYLKRQGDGGVNNPDGNVHGTANMNVDGSIPIDGNVHEAEPGDGVPDDSGNGDAMECNCRCRCRACMSAECNECGMHMSDGNECNCRCMGAMRSKRDRIRAALAELEAEARGDAKTKRVAGEDLTAGDFLYVGDPDKTETWSLPWHFSTEEKTKSHLRNALARFNQTKNIPADKKPGVWKKLVAKCKEHGIDVTEEKSSNLEKAFRDRYLAAL